MKKAFTLVEVLIVVLVLGVLATVAVPKFSRVLETRRTGEAEEILSAVRAEQEKRCILGQSYYGENDRDKVATLKNAGQSTNYTYELGEKWVKAESKKGYTLLMPYKSGEVCCEGEGCSGLNKDYQACKDEPDECTAVVDPCEKNPNQCGCEPYTTNNEQYCKCQTNPDCSCPDYKQEHIKDFCGTCADAEYKELHEDECDLCKQDSYFADHMESCCKMGSDRTECYEYQWVQKEIEPFRCRSCCGPVCDGTGEVNMKIVSICGGGVGLVDPGRNGIMKKAFEKCERKTYSGHHLVLTRQMAAFSDLWTTLTTGSTPTLSSCMNDQVKCNAQTAGISYKVKDSRKSYIQTRVVRTGKDESWKSWWCFGGSCRKDYDGLDCSANERDVDYDKDEHVLDMYGNPYTKDQQLDYANYYLGQFENACMKVNKYTGEVVQ